jgi:hypothetical protein
MTKHITERIDRIIHNGGIVVQQLRMLVDVLEDIRSTESIDREFKESFEHIEKTRGAIMPSVKEEVFRYINCTEKHNYDNQYDGAIRV